MNRGCGVEVLGKGKEGDRDRWGYVRQVPLGRVVGWRVWGLWVSLRWDNLNQLDRDVVDKEGMDSWDH